jgi:hypothetical protein
MISLLKNSREFHRNAHDLGNDLLIDFKKTYVVKSQRSHIHEIRATRTMAAIAIHDEKLPMGIQMRRSSKISTLRKFQLAKLLPLFVVAVVLAAIALDGARSEARYTNAKIENKIISSVRLADLGLKTDRIFDPYTWCFKDAPAFAFVRGQNVLIKTFGGPLQEIMSLDRPLNDQSLECSDDGAVFLCFLVVIQNFS